MNKKAIPKRRPIDLAAENGGKSSMPLDELARRMLSMPPQPKKKAEQKPADKKSAG